MFSCPKCTSSFETERGLNIHVARQHSSKNKDKLQKCTEISQPESTMQFDGKDKDVCQKVFLCTSCTDSFKTEKGLKIHITRKHPPMDQCIPETYAQKTEKESTIKDNDIDKVAFKKACPFNTDWFETESGLKNVGRNHPFKNHDIRQKYSEKDQQEPTVQVNGKDKGACKNSFLCTICADSFKTERGLKIHVTKKHSLRDPDIYQTNSKDKKEPGMQVHSLDKYIFKKAFPCTICSDSFDTENGLKIHVTRKHSSRHPDIYQTNSKVKEQPPMQVHGIDKDILKKAFPCTICSDSFDTGKGLKIHVTRKHSSRDPDIYQTNSEVKEMQALDKDKDVLSIHEPSEYSYDNKKHIQQFTKQTAQMSTIDSETFSVEFQDDLHTDKRFVSPDVLRELNEQVQSNIIPHEEVSQVAVEMEKFLAAFMRILKSKSPNLSWKTFNSGSYYDKTKNTHADEFDIMIYTDNVQVEVDFDDKQVSGFYKVKLMSPRVSADLRDTLNKDGYIKPALFKRYVFGLFDEVFKDTTCHEMRRVKRKEKSDDTSPAYTIFYNSIPQRPIDIDLVPCFRMDGWPAIAKQINPQWITNDKVVNDSIKYYDIVCKTCPDDVLDRDLLWRLSFSYTEKKLITAANDGSSFSTKKKAFRIMKSYIQNTKDKHPDRMKKFCSYHVKQFMLHQFDEWNEEHDIVRTQRLLLDRLIDYLKKPTPYIGNYFIENDNVIRYVPKSEIDLIVLCLEKESAKLR